MSITKPKNTSQPQIEFIDPETISTAGDDFIIFGKNFQQKARVLIDDILVFSSQLNPDALYVKCLPFNCGVFSLVVSNPDGGSVTTSLPIVSAAEAGPIELLTSSDNLLFERKPLPSSENVQDMEED